MLIMLEMHATCWLYQHQLFSLLYFDTCCRSATTESASSFTSSTEPTSALTPTKWVSALLYLLRWICGYYPWLHKGWCFLLTWNADHAWDACNLLALSHLLFSLLYFDTCLLDPPPPSPPPPSPPPPSPPPPSPPPSESQPYCTC